MGVTESDGKAMPMSRSLFGVLFGVLMLLLAAPLAGGQDAAVTYLQRREALPPDDVAGRVRLAQWCQANALPMQAADLYREVLDRRPDHAEAYAALVKITDTNRLPEDQRRQAELLEQFPGMTLHVTRHFLILHDTAEPWARNRAALLEKAHDVFYSTFRRVGFRPLPLRERLVCLLFADHDDYLAYGRKYDNADLGWAAGYYSSTTNRITFYDERQSPQFQQVKQKMAELTGAGDELRGAIRAAAADRNHALVAEHRRRLQQVNGQLTWYRNRHEALSKVGNAAKTVHEAVHQLAFNSNLQSRRVLYPFWLSEGLATNFETDAPARAFGPLHPNDWRKTTLRQLQADDQLLPLEQLIAVGRPDTTDIDRLNAMYTQSWALFGYLFRYERDELNAYMTDLLGKAGQVRDGEALTDEFVEAFGPIDTLQRRYDNYLKRLP